MSVLSELMPVILLLIMVAAGSYAIRRIGDAEHERGRAEAGYERMIEANRRHVDEINGLRAELQRKNEYIAQLEKERETVRYLISSFAMNMKRIGWLYLDKNDSQ